MTAPPPFRSIDHATARVWARPDAVDWARGMMDSAGTLYEGAAREADRLELMGRIPAHAVRVGNERWVVRHFHRGGWMERGFGDRYLRVGTPRPFQEAHASEVARERGIPTPAVMAAATYPAGLFYRGDLVTRFEEGTAELAHLLFGPEEARPRGEPRASLLRSVGSLIQRLSEAGIQHRDLNAKNILVEVTGSEEGDPQSVPLAPRVLVLDLDRCIIRDPGRTPDGWRPMLERLLRSLDRFGTRTGVVVSSEDRAIIGEGVVGT